MDMFKEKVKHFKGFSREICVNKDGTPSSKNHKECIVTIIGHFDTPYEGDYPTASSTTLLLYPDGTSIKRLGNKVQSFVSDHELLDELDNWNTKTHKQNIVKEYRALVIKNLKYLKEEIDRKQDQIDDLKVEYIKVKDSLEEL